jgi:hypothetical protein
LVGPGLIKKWDPRLTDMHALRFQLCCMPAGVRPASGPLPLGKSET